MPTTEHVPMEATLHVDRMPDDVYKLADFRFGYPQYSFTRNLSPPRHAKVVMLDMAQQVPTEYVPGVGMRVTYNSYWIVDDEDPREESEGSRGQNPEGAGRLLFLPSHSWLWE